MGKRATENKNVKKETTKETAPKDGGVKKANTSRKGKNVKATADEIDDIFNKKKISDASEIDDIFNTKSIKEDKTTEKKSKEPVLSKSAKRKAAKKSKQVAEEKAENGEDAEEEEEEEEEEEMTEEQVKKVEEVVFAELAAVKNTKTTQKRAAPPTFDEDFGDSRGIKKTNRTTDDGYPLYDVKDLNIGNGLDTPECPFDCKCCF